MASNQDHSKETKAELNQFTEVPYLSFILFDASSDDDDERVWNEWSVKRKWSWVSGSSGTGLSDAITQRLMPHLGLQSASQVISMFISN